MSSIVTKSAAIVASAALLSLAVVPAFAQPEEVQPPPEEVQPGAERQSTPKVTKETPQDMRLRHARPPKKCRSGADSEEEAEEDCAPTLQCQPPAVVKCQYRSNNQDWICSCK